MKYNTKFNIIESKVRDERIIERLYNIESIPEGEPTFTTSQETDINEMISDGLSINEIMNVIKKW